MGSRRFQRWRRMWKLAPRAAALLALPIAMTPRASHAHRDRTALAQIHAAAPAGALHPILEDLLTYHPGWITRMASSRDPTGGNGDAAYDDELREGGYQVLLDARGEGRITRLWMTADSEKTMPFDYHELWIRIDGATVFRGKPQEWFWGRGPYRAPLVLDGEMSAGAYTSWAPLPFKREAKVLFKSRAHYFQISYRQGAGSSLGPSAEEVSRFLSEQWWTAYAAPAEEATVAPDAALQLAEGDALVTRISLAIDPRDLASLRVRIGARPAFPLSALFGFYPNRDDPARGWPIGGNVFAHVNRESGTLTTRLPIPLRRGERIILESIGGAPVVRAAVEAIPGASGGAHLITDYREQRGPGTPTTFPVLEADGPLTMIAQVHEAIGGARGMPAFLEGDEMVRVDGMLAPSLLGTGMEDYFNGGWYFKRLHNNPLSGLTRQVEHAGATHDDRVYEMSMFRLHALDPITARSGLRFGWEAGEVGADTRVAFRTLSLAYGFRGPVEVSRTRFSLGHGPSSLGAASEWVTSTADAEFAQEPFTFPVRRGGARFEVACSPLTPPSGALVIRDYDAARAGQSATLTLNGVTVARFFAPARNPHRRFAQDAVYVHLDRDDCRDGALRFAIARRSAAWSESAYEVVLYR